MLEQQPSSNKHVLLQFARFLIPYWFSGFVVLICLVFSTVSSLAPPYVTKLIIDEILPTKRHSVLGFAIGILLAIILLNLVLTLVSEYLYAWAGNRIIRDIRIELYRHIIDLPLTFHNRQSAGDLIFRLNNDVRVVQSVLTSSVLGLLHHTLTLIGLVIMLCWLNTELFLLSVVVFPFLAGNLVYFQPRIKRTVESVQQQGSDISSHVIERFNHVPLIQLTNRSEYETAYFRTVLDRLIGSIMQNVTYSVSMATVSSFLVAVVPLLILGWGGYHVMQGVMTLGALIAFMQYASRLFRPVHGLHNLYIGLVRGLVSMRRVLEFMQVRTHVEAHGGRRPFVYDRNIEFKEVHFSFEGRAVLQGVNLNLIKGNTYALVGVSGGGKTTLANLLCGFYSPDRGCIRVDGVPLKEIALRELRQHVGLVSQRVHLFHDSIWENIRYGAYSQETQEIERVIRNVRLDGLDLHAEIGDQGAQLSGGQQQRIAMARALLRPVELLILDEATAALDPASEEAIIQYVRRSLHGKTLLMISHRLSVVRDVDEVIFLDKGRVVDQGPPNTLLTSKGYFAQFFQRQQEPDSSG
ncbi:MAG: ABC transporter ATP-binding protein [Gemmatimonadota bacterium]|nr:ABC transporter ATP-binding protein [Gemmatimonadota bacterium]